MIKKLNYIQIIFIIEQHGERNNYEYYWPLISTTSHLQI
jgi:hypothetical protein